MGEILIAQKIAAEIEAAGDNWPPLKSGLFGGSLEQAKSAKAEFDGFLAGVAF
jgi:hypothetical protein